VLGTANSEEVNARRVSDIACKSKNYTNLNSKSSNKYAVKISMTDETLVEIIWKIERLRKKFESDPYSLSYEDIQLLSAQKSFFENFLI